MATATQTVEFLTWHDYANQIKFFRPDNLALMLREQPPATRATAVENIDTGVFRNMSREAIAILETDTGLDDKKVQLLKHHHQNELTTLDSLLLTVYNPDMTDAATRTDPEKEKDLGRFVPEMALWKNHWVNALKNPDPPIPKQFTAEELEQQEQQYVGSQLIIRPGLVEFVERLYKAEAANLSAMTGFMDWTPLNPNEMFNHMCYVHRKRLVANTPQAIIAIRDAAELALDISDQFPDSKSMVYGAIRTAVEAQDKWWILGQDNPDILTMELLKLASEKLPKDVAVSLIMDTVYRKISQDDVYVNQMLNSEFMYQKDIAIKTLDSFLNLALHTDRDATQRYLISKLNTHGVESLATDLMLMEDKVYDAQLQSVSPNQVKYFGSTYTLQGLPETETAVFEEICFGLLVARNPSGKVIGIYNLYPTFARQSINGDLTVQPTTPKAIVFNRGDPEGEISQEKFQQFINAYPDIINRFIAMYSKRSTSLKSYPPDVIYQYWDYISTQPAKKVRLLDEFMNEYGPMGLLTLLVGEYGSQNVTRLVRFGLNAQEPRAYRDKLGTEHVRSYKSFTEGLFEQYITLQDDAIKYAIRLSPIPEKVAEIRDLILLRAKAILSGAARLYSQNGELTEFQEKYIMNAVLSQRIFLMATVDPEIARQVNIPYQEVRDFFNLHDPTDQDNRIFFYQMIERWFTSSMAKQFTAQYADQTEQLTSAFYQAYKELEKDADKTTADFGLEFSRYAGDFDLELAQKVLPDSTSATKAKVGFIGIGDSRMEEPLIAHVRSKTDKCEFVGIDIEQPEHLPEGVGFRKMNMLELGKNMPHEFRKLMLIWSPYMDVIELKDMMKLVKSLTTAMDNSENATIDVDIAFPFGSHSYEKDISEHSANNPMDPYGMFFKNFEAPGGKNIGKLFYASDPMLITWLFSLFGFECVNFPKNPKDIADLCRKIQKDDSFIAQGPQNDLNQQAVYLTRAGRIRVTYKFKRTGTIPRDAKSILSLLEE